MKKRGWRGEKLAIQERTQVLKDMSSDRVYCFLSMLEIMTYDNMSQALGLIWM